MDKFKALLRSRRFLVAAVGLAVVVFDEAFGVKLDEASVLAVAGIVIAWVLGDSIRNTV